MPDQPRILLLGGKDQKVQEILHLQPNQYDLIQVENWSQGLPRLQTETFDLVVADPTDPILREQTAHLFQAEYILDTLADGVAVLDLDLRVLWCNQTLNSWCGGSATGRLLFDALGSPEQVTPEGNPFHTALLGQSMISRLVGQDQRVLELHVTPVRTERDKISQLIALCQDITDEVQQQQQLEALYQAGRELAALAPDQVAEMSVEERVEVLKQNISRFTHDLLHYDVIEIRLLDRRTNSLEPLLIEGMPIESCERRLMAEAENNGVTGYVAATGKSYVCPDTSTDPLYIEGARGSRSSLTVPLIHQDDLIGTLNVESPQLDAFSQRDVHLMEIFSRDVAAAIQTLELLVAEKRETTTSALEAVNREVALPVDEILAAGTAILERYIGHDPDLGDKLRTIISQARLIKQSIQKVGEDLVPGEATPTRMGELAPPQVKGMRVLVADNDERVRRAAHGILGRWGCIVETARDGQEASTMARLGGPYDAVLADIRLPDITGYEAYCQLREAQPKARVILMTSYGYDPTHSLVKARQDGLRFVLFKPFRIDQLRDALATPDPPPET